MFNIDIRFERTMPSDQIAEVQKAYLSGMTLEEAKKHFDDDRSIMLCDEAILCLAIDRGWNVDAAIAEAVMYMYDYFYDIYETQCDPCGDIVAEAMDYIQETQSQSA